MYCNDSANQLAFVTSVSLLKNWTGTGIASQLLGRCLEHAKVQGIREIMLQVAQNNLTAIKLYKKHGFVDWKSSHSFIYMNLFVETGEDYEQ